MTDLDRVNVTSVISIALDNTWNDVVPEPRTDHDLVTIGLEVDPEPEVPLVWHVIPVYFVS